MIKLKVLETENFFKRAYTDYNTMPNFSLKSPKGIPRIMTNIITPPSEEDIKKIWKSRRTHGVIPKLIYQKGKRVPSVDETQTVPKSAV